MHKGKIFLGCHCEIIPLFKVNCQHPYHCKTESVGGEWEIYLLGNLLMIYTIVVRYTSLGLPNDLSLIRWGLRFFWDTKGNPVTSAHILCPQHVTRESSYVIILGYLTTEFVENLPMSQLWLDGEIPEYFIGPKTSGKPCMLSFRDEMGEALVRMVDSRHRAIRNNWFKTEYSRNWEK